MRKLLLSGSVSLIALAGLAGAANAQTMMFQGPVPNWAGPYVGVEGGYGWGSSRHTDSNGFDSGSFSTQGGLAGGTIGYNWQNGPWVFGAEGDMSWADISGSTSAGGTCGDAVRTCGTRLSDLGTVRGRVGYSFGPIMPYATGGLAVGNVHGGEGSGVGTGASGAGSTYRVGWTAGAGVEDQFSPHWSAKLEYLHVDLGSGPVFTDSFNPPSGSAAERVRFDADILRGGINYKFW